MDRKYTIVITKGKVTETWGALTELCKAHTSSNYHENFSYQTLKDKKFPFTYKGWRFVKVKFRWKENTQ